MCPTTPQTIDVFWIVIIGNQFEKVKQRGDQNVDPLCVFIYPKGNFWKQARHFLDNNHTVGVL